MNIEQWQNIIDLTTKFNRLAHTNEERMTEEYYIKSCNMVEEEYNNEFKVWYDKYKEDVSFDSLIQVADGIGDTIFVTIQACEINNPSALDYSYIQLLRKSKVYTKYRDVFIAPIAHVWDVAEELDLDVYHITEEICRSNMTKFPTVTDVVTYYLEEDCLSGSTYACEKACEMACRAIEASLDEGYQVTYKIRVDTSGTFRVVFFDQNMKVRKPWCYQAPDLIPLI